MNNKISVLLGGLLIALLVIGVVGATAVYAESPLNAQWHGRGPGGGRGLGGEALQVAAEALGMTTDELIDALQSGQTLEEVAESQGVEFEVVQEAIQAARETAIRERIQQAVDEGAITQEHSDWLLEGLEKGFLNGPGGFGLGGRHGPGLDSAPGQTPTAEPTQQSSG